MTGNGLISRNIALYLALGAAAFFYPVLTLPEGATLTGLLVLATAFLVRLFEDHTVEISRPLGLVLLLGAFGLPAVLPPPWWPGGVLLALAGAAGLVRRSWAHRLTSSGLYCGSAFLGGMLLAGPAVYLMAMFDHWAPTGLAAQWLGRLFGSSASFGGSHLYLLTPEESLPFSCAPEWTGFVFQLLVVILVLKALIGMRSRTVVWRLPAFLVLCYIWYGLVFLLQSVIGSALAFFEYPWNPLLHLVAGLPPLLAGLRLSVPRRAAPESAAVVLAPVPFLVLAISAALLYAGVHFQDPGARKSGRVLIDDGHSNWEWVETPMTPVVFGRKTTYNYHGLGRLLERYYKVRITKEALTREALAEIDVLILKTPTRSYDEEEIDAVLEFVDEGGGLYLIGDHTNVFGMGTYLNEIARQVGFEYNFDGVFGLWRRNDQLWEPFGPLQHPTVLHLPYFHFLTSCSIKPRLGCETAIAGPEVGSKLVAYHQSNFFDPHQPRTEHRFGSFIQMIAVRHGKGRVVGFTDSTTYSNFAMFWPGRLEHLLGVIEYLNRSNSIIPWRLLFLLAGLAGIVRVAVRREFKAPLVIPAAALGLLCVIPLLRWSASRSYTLPEAAVVLPACSLDQHYSRVDLPFKDKLKQWDPLNMETFFIWLYRSGRIPMLAERKIPAGSDLHIILNPQRAPEEQDRRAYHEFMENGGALLVAGQPEFFVPEVNEWLSDYGIELGVRLVVDGLVRSRRDTPPVWVDAAMTVKGGDGFYFLDTSEALATSVVVGKGRLIVSGLADCFNNEHLGRYDSVPAELSLEYLKMYYDHVGIDAGDSLSIQTVGDDLPALE